MASAANPFVIVLAGGEGRRLETFTRDARGRRVPKQFFRFGGERSLLTRTLERALRLTSLDRAMAVVLEEQRAWWSRELADLPRANTLSQPANRGTGVAVLHALFEIARRDPDAIALVTPSDHEVEEEWVLIESLRQAVRMASLRPRDLVLLGMTPEESDAEYGWIVPGAANRGRTRAVVSFVEKPDAEWASRLAEAGALVSSFIFAATVRALLDLYQRLQPELLERFAARPGADAHATAPASARWYQRLPALDFSRDLLEHSGSCLRVLAVAPCGWSDLGTPRRLRRWLSRRGVALAPAG